MKRIVSLILLLAACCLGFLGLSADPQILGRTPSSPPCLNEAAIHLTATPSQIAVGQSSVVSWSVEGCSSVGVRLNGVAVATSGSRSFCLGHNTKFTLLVSEMGGGGQKSESAQVEVSYPPHVVIDQNTCDPAGVLKGALEESTNPDNDEQTVELSCGVVIDLSRQSINITQNKRSLIASRDCACGPRTRNDDVPRIFVKDTEPRVDGLKALFSIHSDLVLFSGFRLEGPTPGIGADPYNEIGIGVGPSHCDPTPSNNCAIRHIEFSNMEIYHWSGAGIELHDNVETQERGRLFNTYSVSSPERPAPATVPTEEGGTRPRLWSPKQDVVGAVHIKGNYFHDNRHDHGEGYGVDVSDGAYALIEQNVFNNNRHAIAGGSKNCGGPPGPPENPDKFKGLDYSGYTARDNLILPDGGSHCNSSVCNYVIGGSAIGGGIIGTVLNPSLGVILGGLGVAGGLACHAFDLACWHTHQIDMHGDKNQGPNMGCPKDSCDPEHHWPDLNCHNLLCGTAGETIIIEGNTILYTAGTAIKIRGDPVDKAVVERNVFKHGSFDEAIHQNDNCHGKITHPISRRASNQWGSDPMAELGSGDFYGDGQQDLFMATGFTWWAKSPVTQQWRYLNTMRANNDFDHPLSELKLGDFDGDGVCDVAPRGWQPIRLAESYSKSGTSPWVPLPVIIQ